jgi:hypothetical protein
MDNVEKRKLLTLPGRGNSDPSVVQPVGSRYTDCAIPGPDNVFRLSISVILTVTVHPDASLIPFVSDIVGIVRTFLFSFCETKAVCYGNR